MQLRHLLGAVCWLALVLCQGCSSEDEEAIKTYIQQVNSRPPKPIVPIPEFKKPQKYAYQSARRRDPFQIYRKIRQQGQDNGPDQARLKEPLEAFPLDGLRMVGMLQRDEALWALVRAPNKMIYKVKPGNYLGQNYGKIVSVANDIIRIEEMFRIQNIWEKRTVTLKLATEQ